MSPLERAARALAAYEYGDGHDEPWEPFVAYVRAVLQAIRPASEAMILRGWTGGNPDQGLEPAQVWQAMIDQLLEEG